MKNKMTKSTKKESFDGWANAVTGVGMESQDKRLSARANWQRLSPEFLENLYGGDEIASRIVDLIPDEAMRKGWEFVGIDPEQVVQVESICESMNVHGVVDEAWKMARLYGGALIYMVAEGDPGAPLQEGERIKALHVLTRNDVHIQSSDVESSFASKNWSRPNFYRLNLQMGADFKGYPIHWSRLIRFDGHTLPRRTYIRNNYWHDSVLQRLYNAIRNFQISHDAAALILQDFNVGVYKMKGLASLIASGREDLVRQRLELINFGKSVIRSMILDDEEDFQDVSRNVSGMAELLVKIGERLVAATDIPHTKLLGESPDGSNATGNSTTNSWYNFIEAEQENYLRPKLTDLFSKILPPMPKEFSFKFKTLWQLDDNELADIRLKQSQVDATYIDRGVLLPEEVSKSRFSGEYSVETELMKDEEERDDAGAGFPVGQEEREALLNAETAKPVMASDKKKQEPFISQTMSDPFREPPFNRDVGRTDSGSIVISVVEVVKDGKILMGKRRDSGKWTNPGGHADRGETPGDAALRELSEETGLVLPRSRLVPIQSRVVPNHHRDGRDLVIYHYRVTLDAMEEKAITASKDPDNEVLAWEWVNPKDVMNNLHSKRNIVLEYHGIFKSDANESAFFKKQLSDEK